MTDKEMFDEYEKLLKAAKRVRRRLERQGDEVGFFSKDTRRSSSRKKKRGGNRQKKGSGASGGSMRASQGSSEDLSTDNDHSCNDRMSNRSSQYSKY
jgi:hypothetical protein